MITGGHAIPTDTVIYLEIPTIPIDICEYTDIPINTLRYMLIHVNTYHPDLETAISLQPMIRLT